MSSLQTPCKSQHPKHNHMSGFSSPLTEAPTLSHSPSSLTSCSTVHTIQSTSEPTGRGQSHFYEVYEKPEDVGLRRLHPHSNPFEAPLSGSQSASTLRETNPIYNKCPQTAAQCSPWLKDTLSLHT